MSTDTTARKRSAAERATEFITSGMVVGLGHGSTTAFAVQRLAELLRDGRLTNIVAVPCSNEVAAVAANLGIPLTTLAERSAVDLTIDGADEVDPQMRLIKGGGGALLREKIVARASRREIIVVDDSKLSAKLGTRFALPVEVARADAASAEAWLRSLGANVARRGGEDPFATDSGNCILDCRWPGIDDPEDLARRLDERPEIVDHGLFLGLATDLIVGAEEGVHHFARGEDWTRIFER
jgi:ribose 5-phosphate isomerase A